MQTGLAIPTRHRPGRPPWKQYENRTLEAAIGELDGAKATARRLKVSETAVHQWRCKGRVTDAPSLARLAVLTGLPVGKLAGLSPKEIKTLHQERDLRLALDGPVPPTDDAA